MPNKNKNGFTLIELLIVIAIIGILASVVLVSLNSARNKAKLAKAVSSMQAVAKLVGICRATGGALNYPNSSSAPSGSICADGTGTFPDLSSIGFTYCTNNCGGWCPGAADCGTLNDGVYAISAYSDSYPGGRKIIVCASDMNVSGWYYSGSSFNFSGTSGCKTDGF